MVTIWRTWHQRFQAANLMWQNFRTVNSSTLLQKISSCIAESAPLVWGRSFSSPEMKDATPRGPEYGLIPPTRSLTLMRGAEPTLWGAWTTKMRFTRIINFRFAGILMFGRTL